MSVDLDSLPGLRNKQEQDEQSAAIDSRLFDHSTHNTMSGFQMDYQEQQMAHRTTPSVDNYNAYSDLNNAPPDYSSDGVEFTPMNEIYHSDDGTAFNLSSFIFDDDDFFKSPSYVDDTYPEPTDNNNTVTILPQSSPITNGRIVALAIFTMFFLVGIVGNALVIGTTAKFGSMRKVVTYLYLVNLSVANLLFLLVCLPTSTASYVLVDWPFGLTFCRVEKYIMSVSMSVSVLTITATGLDRYMAIVYPIRSKRFRTTGKTLIIIASIWILSLTLMIPRMQLFNVNSVFHIVGMVKLCERVASQHTLMIDTTLTFLFLYILPLIVLVICHVRIGQTIWRGGRIGSRGNRSYQGGLFGIRERRRIAKIVIAITIVFGVGWLPIHLYNLVEDFDYGNVLLGEFLERGTVALFFSFGANALNPLIYCVISGTYRKHIMNTFLCRKNNSINNRSPTETQVEVSNYRRAAPILQPRPALILPSQPRIQSELNRRLLEPHSSDLFSSATSVEELSGIRVSDIDQISTSSLVKNILVPSPQCMKKESDATSSLLKTMSPSLILTDLEISPDHDKENIDISTQSSTCLLKSSEGVDTYSEYIEPSLSSNPIIEIKAALDEATPDHHYLAKSCDNRFKKIREKESRRSCRVHKLHVTFPHNKLENITKPLHESHNTILPSGLSSLPSVPSTSSPNSNLRIIESQELKSITPTPHNNETSNSSCVQSHVAGPQERLLSSSLQPKKQKLVQIKSFSRTHRDNSDIDSDCIPMCTHQQHKNKTEIVINTPLPKQVLPGKVENTADQFKHSKDFPVLPKGFITSKDKESTVSIENVLCEHVKENRRGSEYDSNRILSKPVLYRHSDKNVNSVQHKNSNYNSQDG